MSEQQQAYRTLDKFDRAMGNLSGLPDATHTKPSTVSNVSAILGVTQTFIIETWRQTEIGDTIFLQCADDSGLVRLVIPPKVADAIARQRDSLTVKVRRAIGKAQAAARKARGELPGFMKNGKKSKSSSV